MDPGYSCQFSIVPCHDGMIYFATFGGKEPGSPEPAPMREAVNGLNRPPARTPGWGEGPSCHCDMWT